MSDAVGRKRFYNFVIVPGVGPDLFGPYGTEGSQQVGLISLIEGHPDVDLEGNSSLYWLELNENGVPSLGQYGTHYLERVREFAKGQKDA